MSDGVPDERLGGGDDLAVLQELLVRLGMAMTMAGESVDDIHRRLDHIAAAYGITDVEVMVLPTALFIETGAGPSARVQLGVRGGLVPRLDQVSDLYDLVHELERGDVAPASGLDRLRTILQRPPPYGRVVRSFGYGVLSVGFSLVLQPSAAGVAVAFALGLAVGILSTWRLTTLRTIMPVLASFLVAVAVFATVDVFELENPVRALIPPLVAFLPGAVLTTGTVELAAGQVISGASRLVQGVVELALLAFGIVAAGTLVGTPDASLVDQPFHRLTVWAPLLGLVVVVIGDHLHHCAPLRSLPWILVVLCTAYAGQSIGAAVFSAELSGFFGALVMTPVVLWLSDSTFGPPSMVTFLPGFWLLVPGAAGLIGVTEIVGTGSALGIDDFSAALITVMSIALGVLIGTAAYRSTRVGLRGLATWPDILMRRQR